MHRPICNCVTNNLQKKIEQLQEKALDPDKKPKLCMIYHMEIM